MAVRVIGLGSPFGDDAAGWRLIDRLRMAGGLGAEVELLALDRPGAGLLRYLQGVEDVLLIDAVRSGKAPGTLHRLTPEQAERLPTSLSSHGFGLAEALRLARMLDAWPGRMEIHGIELADLDGHGLSPAVEAAVDRLADRLMDQLRAVSRGPSPASPLPQDA